MRTFARGRALIDFQRIFLDDEKLAAELLLEFGQGRNAAPVTLDRDNQGTGVEQGAREAAGARPDFVDALSCKGARYRCDPGEKMAIEDEILSECLARAELMAGDDVA